MDITLKLLIPVIVMLSAILLILFKRNNGKTIYEMPYGELLALLAAIIIWSTQILFLIIYFITK